jgi:hypothetical protein
MKAEQYLLPREEILAALGTRLRLVPGNPSAAAATRGDVLAKVAADFAYRSFAGEVVVADSSRPIAVGTMALTFDHSGRAESTFKAVAGAAHLRTQIGACNVAVETVTAASGLVSYWGYVQFGDTIVVLTLDTLDPNVVSMTDFRSLVKVAADRLERQAE